MSFLLSEVRSLSTGTQRSKLYGQDCMRLRFCEAVNKTRPVVHMVLGLRSGATKLPDLDARKNDKQFVDERLLSLSFLPKIFQPWIYATAISENHHCQFNVRRRGFSLRINVKPPDVVYPLLVSEKYRPRLRPYKIARDASYVFCGTPRRHQKRI
ncbi:hypothetical protein IG631_11477 [Alternaria alternata]|nr:hypothetical protein IG631_11477 [Alternaria alternata]